MPTQPNRTRMALPDEWGTAPCRPPERAAMPASGRRHEVGHQCTDDLRRRASRLRGPGPGEDRIKSPPEMSMFLKNAWPRAVAYAAGATQKSWNTKAAVSVKAANASATSRVRKPMASGRRPWPGPRSCWTARSHRWGRASACIWRVLRALSGPPRGAWPCQRGRRGCPSPRTAGRLRPPGPRACAWAAEGNAPARAATPARRACSTGT